MTPEEINKLLEHRPGGKKKLAEELGISYDSLRLILAGNRPLTAQLSRHIEYVLGKRKQQTFIYTVDLPEGTVQSWLPQHANMSEEEMLRLLATDGMLVKRPMVVGDGFVLVGFKETDWAAKLM